MSKLKHMNFLDEYEKGFFNDNMKCSAQQGVCDFVNEKNIKVISIIGTSDDEIALFYEEI